MPSIKYPTTNCLPAKMFSRPFYLLIYLFYVILIIWKTVPLFPLKKFQKRVRILLFLKIKSFLKRQLVTILASLASMDCSRSRSIKSADILRQSTIAGLERSLGSRRGTVCCSFLKCMYRRQQPTKSTLFVMFFIILIIYFVIIIVICFKLLFRFTFLIILLLNLDASNSPRPLLQHLLRF